MAPYEIPVRGKVVGTSEGTSKVTGNPYTMVTVIIGGTPYTVMLNKQYGTLAGVVVDVEQDIVLGLTAYRTEPRVDFLRASSDGNLAAA